MVPRAVLVVLSTVLMFSCYPMTTNLGPDILPEGEERVSLSPAWMTNIIAWEDSASGNENAFLADASVHFRRGFPHNFEAGLRFAGLPWRGGMLTTDLKWQVIPPPFAVAVDMGVSYWPYASWETFVGYHPALLLGHEKLFVNLSYSYLRSNLRVHRAQSVTIGHHWTMEETDSRLTPLFGIHLNSDAPDDLFYSVGINYMIRIEDLTRM